MSRCFWFAFIFFKDSVKVRLAKMKCHMPKEREGEKVLGKSMDQGNVGIDSGH